MLQVYVLSVLDVLEIYCKCFIRVLKKYLFECLHIVSVLSRCCVCFDGFQSFLGVFCKCFRSMF
jgi:hypothetical protein